MGLIPTLETPDQMFTISIDIAKNSPVLTLSISAPPIPKKGDIRSVNYQLIYVIDNITTQILEPQTREVLSSFLGEGLVLYLILEAPLPTRKITKKSQKDPNKQELKKSERVIMQDDGGKGRRMAVMAISSLLLVAMVVAVTVGSRSNSKKDGEISASMKAVEAICQPTDFKDACISSLSAAAKNSSDPKDLIKASFEVAMNEINNVANNSTLFKELEKNPETKKAADDCKELFQDAVDDLKRSFNQVGEFQLSNADKILSNLKIWLSATITYQETCLDGFENTTGDAGERMRELLKTSTELSSNGLAIVSEMSSIIHAMQLTSFKRRLLSASEDADDVVSNIDSLIRWRRLLAHIKHHDSYDDGVHGVIKGRRLLMSSTNMGGHEVLPNWLDESRRKLLQATISPASFFVPSIALTPESTPASAPAPSPFAVEPNVTVAKDGTGKYTTIAEALTEVPKWNNDTFIIYVKEGVYYEYLRVEKWLTYVTLIGDGPTKTRISCDKNYIDGTPTFKTATLSVLADNFIAKDIGVENTAGAIKHQAVALRVQADKTIFYNCHLDGYQDTLYAHTYRQFYRDCKISGTIDFIFGDAASFFQNCTFVVRKPLDNQNCIVTAQGRKERHQPSGIIIHKSLFTADPEYYPLRFKNKAYLARPWKEYSKTVIMESYMEDLIQPDGWLPWMGDFGLNTCYYGEYNNAGPGSDMSHRVKWPGVKTIIPSRAEKFMPPIFFGTDAWVIESGVPYIPSLTTAPPPELATIPQGVDEDPNAPMASPKSASVDSVSTHQIQESKPQSNDQKPKFQESKGHGQETIALPPSTSSAPSLSPIPSEIPSFTDMSSPSPKKGVAPQSIESKVIDQAQITVHDLERELMEEVSEDDMAQNDDMMGNIPDGDEPSPARASPVEAPSEALGVAPSANGPSVSQSPSTAPSQAPAEEDDTDYMPMPASSPGPDADAADDEAPERAPADAVAVPAPTKSGSSKTKHGVQIILSGFAFIAFLAM